MCLRLQHVNKNNSKIVSSIKCANWSYLSEHFVRVPAPNSDQFSLGFSGFLDKVRYGLNIGVYLDPFDTKDWVDIIIDPVIVGKHPFDTIHRHKKLYIQQNKIQVKGRTEVRHQAILFYLQAANRSSTKKNIQLNIDIRNNECCTLLYKMYREYTWANSVNLSSTNPGYMISLPYFERSVGVTLWSEENTGDTLNVYWITDNFKYELLEHNHQDESLYRMRCFGEQVCINYTDLRNMIDGKFITEHYYVYLVPEFKENSDRSVDISDIIGDRPLSLINYLQSLATPNYHHLLSWEETNQICKEVNATLPIFRSKKQLDEVLYLMASIYTPPPIVVLFISLKLSNQYGKVSGTGSSKNYIHQPSWKYVPCTYMRDTPAHL